MSKEINFLENKTFVGSFTLFSKEYLGKLIYESDKKFELILYNTPALFLNQFAPIITQKKDGTIIKVEPKTKPIYTTITGKIYDENDITYYVSLANCFCIHTQIIGTGCTKFHFDYAIFSETHEFDLKEEKNFTMNLYFNTWNEFCYPQGFKTLTTMKNEHDLDISLKNNLKIIFSKEISGEPINENDLFSNLFVSCGKESLNENEISELNNKFKDLIEPYQNKIFKKKDETHKWFISVENVPNVKSISTIIWKFRMLTNILTYDFTTCINMIKLHTRTSDKEHHNAIFYYLNNVKKHPKKSKYSFQRSAFQRRSFNNDEWEIILNNLFKHNNDDWLTNFFYVLSENNSSSYITIFHITRNIDYIGAIGTSRKYGKLKYEQVLLDYIQNLDETLKRAMLELFRNNLTMIKVSNNQQKLRNWKLIGKKLCEFRAYVAHVSEKKQIIPFYKAYKVYKVLELIIIDYVFELLGIETDKRLQYKTFYLNELLR